MKHTLDCKCDGDVCRLGLPKNVEESKAKPRFYKKIVQIQNMVQACVYDEKDICVGWEMSMKTREIGRPVWAKYLIIYKKTNYEILAWAEEFKFYSNILLCDGSRMARLDPVNWEIIKELD